MKSSYTLEELDMFNHLRDQGCAVCVFLPLEVEGMPIDEAEEVMCMSVNDRIPDTQK